LWNNWWNEDWQGKPKYPEKTCPSATLSTTNPTGVMESTVIKFDYTDTEDSTAADMKGMEYLEGTD
jgi:hypothetical protein